MCKQYNLDFYNFELPEELIAKYPKENREEARLLVVDKKGNIHGDTFFYSIKKYLNKNDLIILNNTKVMKTRIYGYRKKDKKKAEVLLLEGSQNIYSALIRGRKKFKLSDILEFKNNLNAEIISFTDDGIKLKFSQSITPELLDIVGVMPIPPYMKRKEEDIDNEYYQTVFSDKYGSYAAPTAGLHFTDELLDEIKKNICDIAHLTLHVGWGTFSPVRDEDIRQHNMHYEDYHLSESLINKIIKTKESGGRVIACGTTSMRALEGNYKEFGKLKQGFHSTNIYIYPPYNFGVVDSIITNFHTPKSSLLMLVSAFAGEENIKKYYQYGVKNRFSFFSYGDAMFIQ